MRLELVSVVMVACNDPGRSNDEPIGVRDGQDVTGFAFLATLISHRLATFLGQCMRTVQIEFRKIQIVANGQNAVFPEVFEAIIVTPLEKMVVNGTVADFFFSETGFLSMGKRSH